MPTITRRLLVLLPCTFFVLSLLFHYRPHQRERIFIPNVPHRESVAFDGMWDYERDKDNLLFNQGQCERAFPGFFAEIDRASADRKHPITLKEIDSIKPRNGHVRAMIYDQQVS